MDNLKMKMSAVANMGENSRRLSSVYVPKRVTEILVEVSMIPDFSVKLSNLDFYVNSFEEEMRKIDAFKRELPFCMHLLKEAIETLKKERVQWREKEGTLMERRQKWPLIEVEKRNWMSSAQLWTTPVHYDNTILSLRSRNENEEEESGFRVGDFGNRGGAILPFHTPPPEKQSVAVSRWPAAAESEPLDLNDVKEAWGGLRRRAAPQQKKQRRCWSPELHMRFVEALQRLGGPNTATPKQIRALMKVEGLTNDEVKSHLQKYRLHIRKLPRGCSWLTRDLSHSGSPQDHLNSGKGGESVGEDEDY